MNLSGAAIQPLLQFYKIPPQQLLVLHDELALALGVCRTKQGGGHAGHNGLRDLMRGLVMIIGAFVSASITQAIKPACMTMCYRILHPKNNRYLRVWQNPSRNMYPYL